MDDLISRKAAIEAINGMIDRFERILADIRESKVDDSVCGMCEYDGAYMGQSGGWFNECPGFDKDDCFKLSDRCRKRWMGDIVLPSAQPETHDKRTETHACDLISRQEAIDAVKDRYYKYGRNAKVQELVWSIEALPSAQLKSYREGYQAGFKDAQSERKRGKWIDYTDEGYVECPFCHSATNCDGNEDELHFCFSCGADMREDDHEAR